MFGSMMGDVDPYGAAGGMPGAGGNTMASMMQRMMPAMRSPAAGGAGRPASPFQMPAGGLMGMMSGRSAPGGLLGMLMQSMGGGAGGAPGAPMSLLPQGLPMGLPPVGPSSFNANGLY